MAGYRHSFLPRLCDIVTAFNLLSVQTVRLLCKSHKSSRCGNVFKALLEIAEIPFLFREMYFSLEFSLKVLSSIVSIWLLSALNLSKFGKLKTVSLKFTVFQLLFKKFLNKFKMTIMCLN